VEFRAPPAPGVPEEDRLQAVAWVRADDGLVLRQDVYISTSKLRFERLPEDEAAEVGKKLFSRPERGRRGRWGRQMWMQQMEEARAAAIRAHRNESRSSAAAH
jgi:hypothetical protein